MTPLQHWPATERRQLVGVFTDIDDTLTTEGAITPDALAALQALQNAGLSVIAITGRPIGWCAPFASTWPVDAMVAENGAVAFIHKKIDLQTTPPLDSLLSKLYQQDASTRAGNFQRMQAVTQRLLRDVPGAALAQDSPGRETDIAIDHSEFTRLPPEQITQVVQIMQAEGMTATVSSIHINGWFGSHNKLSGARWIVQQLYQRELDAELARWVYVGDSANDQVMFQRFAHSVGVANILGVAAQLAHLPRYVTVAERGAGFAEVAAAVLAARQP
jgi:HAD superfamily hydrolase (TIGR01484 family)